MQSDTMKPIDAEVPLATVVGKPVDTAAWADETPAVTTVAIIRSFHQR